MIEEIRNVLVIESWNFFPIVCDDSPLANSASSLTVSDWYSYLFKKLTITVCTNRREIGGGVSGILDLYCFDIEKSY